MDCASAAAVVGLAGRDRAPARAARSAADCIRRCSMNIMPASIPNAISAMRPGSRTANRIRACPPWARSIFISLDPILGAETEIEYDGAEKGGRDRAIVKGRGDGNSI